MRTADGLGWLLGDEGSGLWLGLQAVRHAARHWSSSGLAVRVALHAGAASADDLVHWAAAAALRVVRRARPDRVRLRHPG